MLAPSNPGYGFTPPSTMGADPQQQRRRRLAQALLAVTDASQPQGRMVGRFYVPPSPLESLAAGARRGMELGLAARGDAADSTLGLFRLGKLFGGR
mgnify:CR=1 FL=1